MANVDEGDTKSVAEQHEPSLKRVMGPKLLLLFIVGDILGTGVYALTGDVAAEIGGAAWLPFIVAFAVATITAFSYLELVTKYPQAAGAALYVHKAFGIQFLTFLVCFVVMSSGITSASTASRAFASNLSAGFGLDLGGGGIVLIALGFMLLVAIVNFRGVGESVKLNVVLTLIELSGLLLVIMVGLFAIFGGNADFSQVVAFETPEDKSVFLAVTTATSLAFFAMVGFEDSVNMAEETKDPVRIFPRVMLTGLSITGVIYVLVAIAAVSLVPVGTLAASDTPLVEVVKAGAPNLPIEDILPFISMFAVANSALINMLMASRLLYGMARQRVLPPAFGRVHPTRRTPWVAIIFTTAAVLRFDHLRVARGIRRGGDARRHDRAAAAGRLLAGQPRRAGAATGQATPRLVLPRADGAADHRHAELPVSRDAALRPGVRAVRRGGLAAGRRHRAVRHQLADQQAARREAHQPVHRGRRDQHPRAGQLARRASGAAAHQPLPCGRADEGRDFGTAVTEVNNFSRAGGS